MSSQWHKLVFCEKVHKALAAKTVLPSSCVILSLTAYTQCPTVRGSPPLINVAQWSALFSNSNLVSFCKGERKETGGEKKIKIKLISDQKRAPFPWLIWPSWLIMTRTCKENAQNGREPIPSPHHHIFALSRGSFLFVRCSLHLKETFVISLCTCFLSAIEFLFSKHKPRTNSDATELANKTSSALSVSEL